METCVSSHALNMGILCLCLLQPVCKLQKEVVIFCPNVYNMLHIAACCVMIKTGIPEGFRLLYSSRRFAGEPIVLIMYDELPAVIQHVLFQRCLY